MNYHFLRQHNSSQIFLNFASTFESLLCTDYNILLSKVKTRETGEWIEDYEKYRLAKCTSFVSFAIVQINLVKSLYPSNPSIIIRLIIRIFVSFYFIYNIRKNTCVLQLYLLMLNTCRLGKHSTSLKVADYVFPLSIFSLILLRD